jgi:transposase-like protein
MGVRSSAHFLSGVENDTHPPNQPSRWRGSVIPANGTGRAGDAASGCDGVADSDRATVSADLAIVLALARRARSQAIGAGCPRCGHLRVIRWGGFTGRQRYRCQGCRRTFSDFTGTHAAHCKRAELLVRHADQLLAGMTLRRVAALVGVSLATAFRWRHRTLGALRLTRDPALGGSIGLVELVLRHSEKGSRKLDRPPHRHAGVPVGDERVITIFARAAGGATAAEIVGQRFTTAAMLVGLFRERVSVGSTIIARSGRLGACAQACRRSGLLFRPAAAHEVWRNVIPALRAARSLRSGYRAWSRRFFGVATRYLPHYLRWYRFVFDVSGDPEDRPAAAQLLLAGFTGTYLSRATHSPA